MLALEEAEELELDALLDAVEPVLALVLLSPPSPPSPLPVLPATLVELAGEVVLGLDDESPPSPELPPAPPSPEPELSPPAPLEVAGVSLPSAQAATPARAHTAKHRARDRAWGERGHIMSTTVDQLRRGRKLTARSPHPWAAMAGEAVPQAAPPLRAKGTSARPPSTAAGSRARAAGQ